jgi:hypothetical protein
VAHYRYPALRRRSGFRICGPSGAVTGSRSGPSFRSQARLSRAPANSPVESGRARVVMKRLVQRETLAKAPVQMAPRRRSGSGRTAARFSSMLSDFRIVSNSFVNFVSWSVPHGVVRRKGASSPPSLARQARCGPLFLGLPEKGSVASRRSTHAAFQAAWMTLVSAVFGQHLPAPSHRPKRPSVVREPAEVAPRYDETRYEPPDSSMRATAAPKLAKPDNIPLMS